MASTGERPMLRPRALPVGSRIGVCAPSGPVNAEVLARCLEFWHSAGYEVRCAEHLKGRDGYLSAEDDVRRTDFEALLEDPDVHGIVFARGGFGIARWLRDFDFERIRRARKLLIGYSDATVLLNQAALRTGVPNIHGPMLERDDLEADAFSRLVSLVRGEAEGLAPLVGKRGSGGSARGRLVGGNLAVLVSAIGTPFDVDTHGKVLFLEETGVQPYALDRLMIQMRDAGKLDGVAGVALGQFVNCESERYPDVSACDAVCRVLRDCVDGPIVLDLPFGHVADHLALGIGIEVELDGGQGSLAHLESVVESHREEAP